MKKKVLAFILAVCLIIPCMFTLAACGGEQQERIMPAPINVEVVYTRVSNFEELNAALDNNIEDDVIQLLADIDLETANDNQTLTIDSGKNILDLNGHTLTGVDDGASNWYVINLKGESTELVVKDSSTTQTGLIVGKCYGFQISRGAKLTVDSGKFICTQNGTYDEMFVVYGGTLVVNGGAFTCTNDIVYGSSFTWSSVSYANDITINGGVFTSSKSFSDNEYPAMFIFEKGEYGNTETQTVKINRGTFNKGNLGYVVKYDSYVNFTNGANIASSNILVQP